MIAKIKKSLYFPVALYFSFFAGIRLRRWNPKIIVVTGSNGKTTLLHLLESQIGSLAKYSHHANSSFGIPFDILNLHRESLFKSEWISLFLKAPFAAFKNPPREKIYVVEADCDRPGEGKFLATLLNPEIVLWISTAKTHSINFESLVSKRHPEFISGSKEIPKPSNSAGRQVRNDKFTTVEEAITYEFGYFIEYCSELAIINGDSDLIRRQVSRTKTKVEEVKIQNLKSYNFDSSGTHFEIENTKYNFKFLLPEEVASSIMLCKKTVEYLNLAFDSSFSSFEMPPGRGSIFQGIKNITIVDSSYNSNLSSASTILNSFGKMKASKKWLVIGDMLEQGSSEKEEHEKLAEFIKKYSFEKIILMGPRVSNFTYPKLMSLRATRSNPERDRHAFQARDDNNSVVKFLGPKETLEYINENIKGGETMLFKGARFMEGIIEHLLENKKDIKKLARREKIWEIRRKKWGL